MQPWGVEGTDEFDAWISGLAGDELKVVTRTVQILAHFGPQLAYPYSSGVIGSRHKHMRELRIQHAGRPYRVLYAFDPRRKAILLLGGDKTGDDRWYLRMVPMADRLYDLHLVDLAKKGLI